MPVDPVQPVEESRACAKSNIFSTLNGACPEILKVTPGALAALPFTVFGGAFGLGVILGTCPRHMQGNAWMGEQRHVRLFRNGRNQAVRIPVEFELPGDEAIMHRNGDKLVIEPVRKRGLLALLESMKPLEEEFSEIDDPVPERERVL
jgi:antitoxin VapB